MSAPNTQKKAPESRKTGAIQQKQPIGETGRGGDGITSTHARKAARKGEIPPTRENVRAALSHLSPDLDRATWARTLTAIKSALGEDGRDIAQAWSEPGASYSAADFRDTWKSIQASGKTTIATLWRMALDAGWKPDGEAHQETEAERLERERKRAEREKKEADKAARKARVAETTAHALKIEAKPAGTDHPYLIRKGIQPTPNLFEATAERLAEITGYTPKSDGEPLAGRVLLAFVEKGDQRPTVEFIDEAGRKSALAGGPKSGGYWPAQALPEGDGAGSTLAIGEGMATTITGQEATGDHGVAALSASNLPKVAKAMHERCPAARLLILGDLGNGQEYAERAARENAAALALPKFTPEQVAAHQERHGQPPTDFNDLAALAGLEEVRRQIAQALRGEPPETPEPATAPTASAPKPPPTALPNGYKLTARALWYIPESTAEGGEAESANPGDESKIFVSSPLHVTAETRSKDQTGWGRLLEWQDRDGHPHAWTIPMSMLEGEPSAVCAILADRGLITGIGSKSRNLLIRYVKECAPGVKVRSTDSTGWHGQAYVMTGQTIGDNAGERVLYQGGGAGMGDFRQKGTAADWRAHVAPLCAGNSRALFAVGMAFAAPLLRFAQGEESGGAHLRGDSSSGKSTLLWLAASIYGPPTGQDSFRKEWRATGNAMEGTATSRNDSLLILDEMGQVDGKEAGAIAYMLANGQPKLRMTENIALRKTSTWRLLFLSTGEVSLAEHMAAAGKTIKAGQENRLADIPAAPFTGFGVFDTLNGYPSGAALSVAIREATAQYHGAVGVAFIERLIQVQDSLPDRIKATTARFVADAVPKGASGQVDRVAKRFGLVATALELAGEFGLTGWDADECTGAVKQCFAGWLNQRGGAGDHEVSAILSQVRAFFEANGESRFSDWDAAERVENGADLESRAVAGRVGFKRRDRNQGYAFYVLPEAFKREICAGLDPERAAQVLKAHGWIEPDSQGKTQQKPRLPGFGKPTRCYVFTPKMWESP
ncbi:putative DNA primase/helicase [Methylomagnum ishizawai]|uniref:Putative DNA primase/helicase n=1 Tax=Methylomagnum ishizawai TaxID=1760988 RepID=A0A1Y6D1S4_9GAMM|nr:DUF927 domain-containing protein [Methylomagnum ishizawai]SMF96536.1 putative DNA primase/helicase [Methylomagnum ishizawai]